MSAKKPVGLLSYHQSKDECQQRLAGEADLRPKDPLQINPPARLTGHPAASGLWRQTIKMYQGLSTEIVSLLDQGILVDYCIMNEQLSEMDQLRITACKNYASAQKMLDRLVKKNELDPKLLIKQLNAVNWALDEIVKLDARVDRKRALLYALRMALYLTPRSRAGVVPPEKAPEKPKSAMEKLLDGD
jgi:hypothetical protein